MSRKRSNEFGEKKKKKKATYFVDVEKKNVHTWALGTLVLSPLTPY
jgi:hypothetical protein